ncbi:uncharacterized protein LOC6565478 [Drosophila grimshawi]|uniref:GH12000 n=1 Tax=Drosophila grimshawi TaxID=7222 RepID=B4JKT2_DROGR|nr:uncharacterized protein LOC6565478 [Drosophila grimshawi]EDW00185.1 GH12000 [Drosophila grimshawi]
MLCHDHLFCVMLLGQLLVLPLLHATPVSSPEIPNKTSKSPNSVQTQQQLHKTNPNGQEAHLNSLSAFASSYDNLGTVQAQMQPAAEAGFKPSYKLPEMETNFTPMQSATLGETSSISSLPSTPMLMQYLPAQTLEDGSGTVQYLQLIPTRPIIVPISPFLQAAASGGTPANQSPSITPNIATVPDYGARGVQLSALPANTGMTGIHYSAAGLQGYASAIPPVAAYRSSYRINREAKDKSFPAAFSLNLNEYLPSVTGDVSAAGSASHPHTQLYIRARP